MTTPAVRIRMLERLAVAQTSPLLERVFDSGIRVEHALPVEEFDGVQKVAARTDRRIDLETVFDAGREIVASVAGSCMHGARSGVQRHVVSEDADRVAGVERMPEADVFQVGTLHPRD